MSDVVISVENLSKRYSIGRRRPGVLERLGLSAKPSAVAARVPAAAVDADSPHFWALKAVSFEVNRGEVVGIIGRNGAGKSTLLKILSRITEPTDGRVCMRGRLGSLLEVGTGFHPDLTGRENIYLNGSLLGMRKWEIDRKFDEIVTFSEIEKFLDSPVKHYSSGMYTRLAFAVAAHLEPEILVIDEVLAVGDAQFQKKCLGKMGEVAKAGRTVLFVSHNMAAVQTLCREAVWLDAGKVVDHGASRDVVGHYLRSGMKNHLEQNWPAIDRAPGNDKVRLRRAAVTLACESPGGLIFVHTPLDLHFEYWNLVDSAVLNLSVVVADETGAPIFNTVPLGESQWIGHHFPKGLFRSTCRIPGNLLNDGRHRIQLYVVEDGSVCIFRHDDILSFDVCDDPDQRRHWFGEWIGAVRPVLDWETVFVGNAT